MLKNIVKFQGSGIASQDSNIPGVRTKHGRDIRETIWAERGLRDSRE